MRARLKHLFFAVSRSVEPVVPLDLLWFALLPLAVVRALRQFPRAPRDLPARSLPAGPDDRHPSAMARFQFWVQANIRQFVFAWTDRFAEPRWQRRISVEGLERLQAALSGPVVIGALHLRGTLILNRWLRAQGITVGAVAGEGDWFTNAAWRERAVLGTGRATPLIFLPGSGREMARFLTPGRALLVVPDAPLGHLVTGTWNGLELRLASGGFRLARMTGATFIPVVAVETGRWRWRLVFAEPIPAHLIDRRDGTDAASWFAAQLLPEVLGHPREATGPLVEALTAANAEAAP